VVLAGTAAASPWRSKWFRVAQRYDVGKAEYIELISD
jgi:hypothetical protein